MARGFSLSASPICSQTRRMYAQIEVAVGLARRADANKRQFSFPYCLSGTRRGAQPARCDRRRDDLADFRLNDWRVAAVYQVYFGFDWVDTDDFMSVIGEASRRNRADIA